MKPVWKENQSMSNRTTRAIALCNEAIPAEDIQSEAKAKGISTATLNRAKKEIEVVTYREGEPGRKGGGQWFWKMPKGD